MKAEAMAHSLGRSSELVSDSVMELLWAAAMALAMAEKSGCLMAAVLDGVKVQESVVAWACLSDEAKEVTTALE